MAFTRHLQFLKFPSFLSNLLRFRRNLPIGLYSTQVVSLEEELDFPELLPKELRFAFRKNPSFKGRVASILKSGKAIGVLTVEKTPERVLSAINNISVLSQQRTIITWLPHLLLSQVQPTFLPHDREAAAKSSISLDEEVNIILAHRLDFKKFILIDEDSHGITESEKALIAELNETISPIVIRHVISRMTFDNADTRTATAQAIIKALLVIGPITHALEHFTRGFGKIFAASTDDVLAETAELFALRGSGFTWKQLIVRSRILIPVFILATIGAFNVDALIDQGRLSLGGAVFGVSSVALSLTTALQSVRMYKQCIDHLMKEGKLPAAGSSRAWLLAVQQDFTNPARLGLFIGAVLSPLISMTVFVGFSEFVHNGWVLAILGTTETITAGAVVILARKLNALKFQIELSRLLKEQSKRNHA